MFLALIDVWIGRSTRGGAVPSWQYLPRRSSRVA